MKLENEIVWNLPYDFPAVWTTTTAAATGLLLLLDWLYVRTPLYMLISVYLIIGETVADSALRLTNA